MGLFVVLLCIVGAIVAQHARHHSMGTTEGRLSCLEDMYLRVQNEEARLKQQMAEQKDRNAYLENELGNVKTKQQQIEEKHEASRTQIKELEDAVDTAVAFTAFATSSRTYNYLQTISFDRVITNVGNHFNEDTNKFTCPKRGLYLFSLTLYQASYAADYIRGAIMVDGNEIGEVRANSDDDDESGKRESDQSSITTTVVCDANQNVWVRQDGGSGELYGTTSFPGTMFTGVLIQSL